MGKPKLRLQVIFWKQFLKQNKFNFEHYDKIILSKPDIIIIGCGDTQILPSPDFINNFTSQDIGVEIMTTESACKTFNVLISEHRKVVAGLTLWYRGCIQ